MFLEGYDQHSRWFLSSTVLSLVLADQAPFQTLKTHGLILDPSGAKLSKSVNSEDQQFDPTDFIDGSLKADGTRKFGYGLDVMRAWCAFKDTDRNVQVSQIEAVNKEVKLYRDVLKVILHHLQGFDPSQAMLGPSLFKDLTFVDGMMMVKLLDFSNRVTDAFDKFDLAAVYQMTQKFLVNDVSDFYLDFTKYRRRRLASPSHGTLGVLYHLANTLVVTTAPILCLTSQEAFEHLPLADRPPTVF